MKPHVRESYNIHTQPLHSGTRGEAQAGPFYVYFVRLLVLTGRHMVKKWHGHDRDVNVKRIEPIPTKYATNI
jgi:hypothetical protein